MQSSVSVVNQGYRTRTETASRWWRQVVTLLGLWLIGAAAAWMLLTTIPGFPSNDDYYHVRLSAQIMEQGKLRVDFPWLPLTILDPAQFVDHHLLYHLYLAPFVYVGGAAGAKLAHAMVVGGLFLCFGALLRAIGVRYSSLWTVALLGISAPFLYRMLMIRTQAPALLVLLAALYVLHTDRPRWLLLLAFAFTWLYNGFILLPVLVGVYALAALITDRKMLWRPVAYATAGMVLGLIFNPYFPTNLSFILSHLGEKVDVAASVRVGNEWYPYTTGALLENSPGALLALAAAVLAPSFRGVTGRNRTETALLLIALLTLFMVFRSRRFIEYFPAFALLFCAAAWGRQNSLWREYLPPNWSPRISRWLPRLVPVALALLIGTGGWLTVGRVRDDLLAEKDDRYLAGAAQWLAANSAPVSMVFQTDWDDFPYLFYHNTHNTYLVGLDPTYLQVANPDLWNLWVAITQGTVERPSVLIRDTFKAVYVVSDAHHDAFASRADSDPEMILVYRDDNSLIWQVKAVPTQLQE